MYSIILQFVCWSYLPDFATRQVLSVIYRILQKTPPPRSPEYVRHYRYAYAAVVLCYLTYNFVDASSGLGKNFYELLGVSPRSDEGALKAAFRAFARKNHPDRIGPEGEALFIDVRDAFEALKDPVVRFAYDRFGPDVLGWRECTTMKDYLRRGLLNALPRHIVTGVALFLFSMVGKRNPVAVWRYLLFMGMFAIEMYLIVAPSPAGPRGSGFVDEVSAPWMPLESVFPQRVAYQHVELLRQVFMFLSVAVSRVAPVLFPEVDAEVEGGAVRAMAGRVGELTKGIEREVYLMLKGELDVVGGDEFGVQVLMREMEEMVIENKLKSESGPVRSAWDKTVNRSRARCNSL